MSKQLKQVISLSKKTGDRIIVFDNSEPDNSFALMSLSQYEELLEKTNEKKVLTEDKIIDNIEKLSNKIEKKENNWKISSDIEKESEQN